MKKRVLLFLYILLTFNAFAQLLPVTPWKELGPIKFPINASGQINGIGRTCQIKHHATDTSIIYAVTSSGGLYKTTDGANNWFNLTGSIYLPKGSQASVCIDYANDNIIYLGTGDANYYSSGTGVWKSSNGGLSFVQKSTGMGNRLVDEILQSPTNRGVLIAATNSGIYKSNDSANTWTLKTPSGLRFTDMEYKPGSNGRVIYAVTLDSGYYRSIDFGETWTNLMNTGGLFIPSGGSSNGMRVAVCPADTNIVYIGMVKNFGTIFKSNDGGTTFSAMKNASMPNLTGYNNTAGDGGQGNYNFDINCDPINPSILYLVSHNVWKSTDSGINWVQKTNWWAVVHTDMHHISFSPHNKSKHFNSNDGGIWLTTDGTNSWSQKSDGLAANEISPAASSNLDYKCISTGTQDNGELYRDDTGVWKTNRGGDWYEKMNYDWKNPRTVYYITGKRRLVNGSEVSLNFPFTGNANYIDFNPKAQNSAVISKNDSLWISKNIQDPIPTWSFIGAFSGNNIKSVAWSIKDTNRLYLINSNSKVYRTDNLYTTTPVFNLFNTPSTTNTTASIAVIAKNDSIVYISCGNIIYRSNNAGNTWTNIKYNYPAVNVIRLYHDPYTSNESIYTVGSIAVYFKMDTMTSWQNLTQSLPTNASIQSVIPYNEGTDKSEMRVAYFGKGVWSIPIQTQKIPNAKFGANYTKLCSLGKTISFTDSSSNNPTSWTWSFPGGTPSSSTLQNPTIVYNTPGVYDVTLTATNANGSYTETKTAYISVFKGDTLPISENFESGILPVNWTVFNDGNDNRLWVREDTLSAYGVGSKSYRFDNRAYMNTSKKDAIVTSVLNLNAYDSVWVSFDRAFAPSYWSQWYSDSRDTLQVAVDNSCNTGSLTSVWMKGHTSLATGTVQADGAYFKPTTSQWKKDTINLTAFAGQKEISLYFRIFKTLSGGYGQVIYLDNINFWGKKSVVKDTALSASICSGNNYVFGANTLNTTGTYKDTIRKINTGADSIRRTLTLTVNPKTFNSINQTICQGQSFLFNGINRSVSGAYLDTLLNSKGCDSILTLNLTVNPNSTHSISQTVCQGQSFLFNGINRTVSGTYLDTLVNAKGCDSFLTLNLTVNPNSSNTINQSICQGQSFLFNGINRTVSGLYFDTLVNAKGCDSFLTLNLTVNPNSSNSINQTICQGQSFLFNGINRSVSGAYLDTLVNSKGCDSFLTLNLTVNSNSNKTISQSICQGQSFLFNGINRSVSGAYLDTLVNSKGCDSFLTLNLTVNPNSSNSINQTICQGQSFLFNGINRTVSGTYLDTLVNAKGCDSLLTLNLVVNLPTSNSINQSICQGQSFLFNGINRTVSGTYLDTLVNAKGCDSFLTLNLTVNPNSSNSISQTICQGQSFLFNGINRTVSGTYLDTLVNAKGCDSFLTLNLTVNSNSNKTISQSICQGQSYLFNGINRSVSGAYLDTLVNAKGCDSFLTLNLTVNSNSNKTISQSICQGQSFLFNGINRTLSGTYLDTLVNAKGCDSFLTLNLVVNLPTSNSINQTICQGQSFLFNGINRTVSGTYLDTVVNAKGCDSFLTLNLVVNLPTSNAINQTICQGQSFLFNGINRTVSGTYLDTLVNAKGCDSFLTLNLTVNPNSSNSISQTICQGQSFLFNGINRTVSGTYLDTLLNSKGCDSILTLNLTVTPNSSKTISQTICQGQSIMFNGIGRTTSGTYLDTLVNFKGCDSILTLNLTVNPLPQPVIIGDSILCDSVVLTVSQNFASYLWATGGNTKSIVVKNSGNYVCVVTSTDGCTNQASFSIINGKINNQPLIQVSRNIICSSNDSAELSASAGFNNYKWSNNIQGTNKIVVKSSGNYFVTVYNNMGCSAIATTSVLSKPANSLQIGLNSKYCIEDSIIPFAASSSIPCLSSQKTFNNVSATNLNFKNYVPGKYMASYTCIDTNNCTTVVTKEISLVNCPLSGLVTNDFSNKIIIYPNPARNSCVLEFLEMGQYQIAIYSTLGQLIHNQSVDNEKQLKMDVSKWAKGVYYIRIYSKDMNLMDTKKLEIE